MMMIKLLRSNRFLAISSASVNVQPDEAPQVGRPDLVPAGGQ